MRRFWIAAAAGTLMSGAAVAADLPTKAPPLAPAPVPVTTWNGCYLGVVGGWIEGRSRVTEAGTGDFITRPRDSGGTAGGTIGCNIQWSTLVLGIENDLSWAGLSGSHSDENGFNPAFSHAFKTTWLDTLRGRVGIASGSWLFFVTGGAAFTHVRDTANNGAGTILTIGHDEVGWVGGGGIEWMFAPKLSLKAEYLRADFGRKNSNFAALNGLFSNVNTRLTEDMVRLGLNWHL